MALPQVEPASHVTAIHMVPSHSTVMKTVSVGVSLASPDPNVTGAHEDISTFRREGAHVSTEFLVYFSQRAFPHFSQQMQVRNL